MGERWERTFVSAGIRSRTREVFLLAQAWVEGMFGHARSFFFTWVGDDVVVCSDEGGFDFRWSREVGDSSRSI